MKRKGKKKKKRRERKARRGWCFCAPEGHWWLLKEAVAASPSSLPSVGLGETCLGVNSTGKLGQLLGQFFLLWKNMAL